ncbi:hypothetical protein Tco_1344132 [Tanacetum coccineum]
MGSSVGFSGGIACIWDPNRFILDHVSKSDYFVALMDGMGKDRVWVILMKFGRENKKDLPLFLINMVAMLSSFYCFNSLIDLPGRDLVNGVSYKRLKQQCGIVVLINLPGQTFLLLNSSEGILFTFGHLRICNAGLYKEASGLIGTSLCFKKNGGLGVFSDDGSHGAIGDSSRFNKMTWRDISSLVIFEGSRSTRVFIDDEFLQFYVPSRWIKHLPIKNKRVRLEGFSMMRYHQIQLYLRGIDIPS